LNEIPGVLSATLTPNLPLRGSDFTSFVFQGDEYPPDADYPTTKLKLVAPRYFETMGIDLLQGRDFTDADIAGGLIVAIVNKSFVDRWTPGESPLGRKARGAQDGPEDPWYTVVGVVEDEWTDNENSTPEMAYGCLFQGDAFFISLVLRTEGNPMSLVPAVRDAVMSVDHDLPIYWVMSMSDVIFDSTWFYGVLGSIIMISGLFALFLATIGLYAVMVFSVNRRMQEIGVRMALGAEPIALVRMVVKQGTIHLVIGLLAGLLLSFALAQGVRAILFGVSPGDPVILTLIVLILIGTGLLASLVPALRATRVDPVSALRQE
jgi:predicted permease